MPCSVAVWESDAGKAVVEIVDAMKALVTSGGAAFDPIGEQVGEKLARVLGQLA